MLYNFKKQFGLGSYVMPIEFLKFTQYNNKRRVV